MKKTLFCLSLLLLQQLHSQTYNTRVFGNANTYEGNAQFAIGPSNNGYVFAGWHQPAGGSPSEVHLIRMNNGANPVGLYHNRIALKEPGASVNNTSYASSIARIGSTDEYMVAGVVIVAGGQQPNQDIFLMKINIVSGTILWVLRYDLQNFIPKEPNIKMDLNDANLLVTGGCSNINNLGNLNDVYALSVDVSTGLVNWSQTYHFPPSIDPAQGDFGEDIIHNPYSSSEAIIVGGSSGEGLLMQVDINNGMPVNPATRYQIGTGTRQHFTCINKSNNTAYNNPFLVGGNVLQGGTNQMDAWALMIDENGSVSWSTTLDNTTLPFSENNLKEVTERLNTSFNYEYYTAGMVISSLNNRDIHVVKLDAGGIPVASGEFIYGEPNYNEEAMDIHPANNNAGIVMSANTTYHGGAQMFKRAYNNGYTSESNLCDFVIQEASYENPLPVLTEIGPELIEPEVTLFELEHSTATLGFLNLCTGGNSNGSDARETIITGIIESEEGGNFDFAVVEGENNTSESKHLNLKLNTGSSGPFFVRVVDVLGREIPCALNTRGDLVDLEIRANLASSGIYYVTLGSNGEFSTKAVLIK